MKVRVVHQPNAGDGTVDRERLLAAIEAAGHDIVGYCTIDDDWRDELDDGDDDELVVVAGGDGTIRKVFVALAGSPARAAIVASGTANNIARHLGIDSTEPLSTVDDWVDPAPVVHLDVPTVLSRKGPRRFVEGIGGGLFAELLRRADERERQGDTPVDVWETMSEVLADWDVAHWAIDVDGADHSGSYLAVHATNISHTGPNIAIAPTSRLDDGLVDLVLVTSDDREAIVDYVERRRGASADGSAPPFTTVSGRQLILTPPADWLMTVDDDVKRLRWFGADDEKSIRIDGASRTVPVIAARADA